MPNPPADTTGASRTVPARTLQLVILENDHMPVSPVLAQMKEMGFAVASAINNQAYTTMKWPLKNAQGKPMTEGEILEHLTVWEMNVADKFQHLRQYDGYPPRALENPGYAWFDHHALAQPCIQGNTEALKMLSNYIGRARKALPGWKILCYFTPQRQPNIEGSPQHFYGKMHDLPDGWAPDIYVFNTAEMDNGKEQKQCDELVEFACGLGQGAWVRGQGSGPGVYPAFCDFKTNEPRRVLTAPEFIERLGAVTEPGKYGVRERIRHNVKGLCWWRTNLSTQATDMATLTRLKRWMAAL